jgi:Tol biopolymer transport system component
VHGGLPEILSQSDPFVPSPVVGNGDSLSRQVSSDGRFILFSSLANDLVTNDNGYLGLDVFLRDRLCNATILVSANFNGTGGGDGHSLAGQVSTNGRYALFESDASNLLPGDTNGVSDVFVRDLQLATNILVSVAVDGGWGNGASTKAVMTPDGRWVAFVSSATNLVSGDTNGIPDLFVRDLTNGTIAWVTAGATDANAIVSSPAISPDGRYVAFFSTAKSLVAGVPADTKGEIYLYDSLLNKMAWASTNAAGTALVVLNLTNMPSYHPALSDDGRYMAFKTGWTNGTVSPSGSGVAAAIVFFYDMVSQSATILSTNAFPPWSLSDDVYGPEMTPDGRFVAFVEREAIVTTNFSSVRLWDRQTGTNVIVSVSPNGLWPTNTTSHTPAVSRDGRFVTFLSDATNLVGNAVSNGLHIYRRDLQASTTVLVDVDTNGVGSTDQFGTIPFMSAGGAYVVYSSLDGGFVNSDNNKASDVFLWDATTGTNVLISARDPLARSVSGNGPSSLGQISLSGNGGAAAFASFASDLVTNDFNQDCDVFVRDLIRNTNTLVSLSLDGNSGLGGASHSPLISSDGRYVVFVSSATNLVLGDTNLASDVFLRDLVTGSTVLVSVNSSGNSLGNAGCSFPVISQDGRYVAFLCRTNVANSQPTLFWRDINSGLTRLITNSAHSTRVVSMSGDGKRVAYFNNLAALYVWDANLLAHIYTNTGSQLTSAAISPAGNRLLYQTTSQLFFRDLPGLTNTPLDSSSVQIKGPSQWSSDGRYVTFVTASDLVAGDSNGLNDVYLRDLQTGTLTLVSVNQGGTASATGTSDSPVLSADGRFVAFRSFASDVAYGTVGTPSLVMFDRLTGTNRLLVTGTIGNGWTTWASRPSLSGSGERLAFQSWDSGLVAGDLNRAGDVLASIVNSPALDSDGDGIPDWWMTQYFGHPTAQAGDSSRAQDDADGDGFTNLNEFLAGTNPGSASSVLTLHIVTGAAGSNVTLNWEALPGRSYHALFTDDLNNPNWQVVPGSNASNQGHFTVQAAGSQRYFRVQCGD